MIFSAQNALLVDISIVVCNELRYDQNIEVEDTFTLDSNLTLVRCCFFSSMTIGQRNFR